MMIEQRAMNDAWENRQIKNGASATVSRMRLVHLYRNLKVLTCTNPVGRDEDLILTNEESEKDRDGDEGPERISERDEKHTKS